MKKHLLVTWLLCIAFALGAWTQTDPLPSEKCEPFLPFGVPKDQKNLAHICRHGYFVGFDSNAKIPAYSAYLLTPTHSLGCVERSNGFQKDKSIDASASPKDYLHSGYDIGHISPDGDQSYDPVTEHESFLLTNMAPQLPGFNRGIWKLAESAARAWALEKNAPMYIISGPVYDTLVDKKIGPDNVDVPSGFFKIVVDTNTNESLAFLFDHKEDQGNDLNPFLTKIKTIESKTGLSFQMRDTKEGAKIWNVDYGSFTRKKKATCQVNLN